MAALSSAQKLEDWFDKEVHIPMMKQPTTIKKKSTATPPHITTTAKASQPVEQNIDFIFLDDDDDDINVSNQTMQVMHENTCHPANDSSEMKPPTTMTPCGVLLDDFNSHIFNDEHNISKVIDSSILEQPTHTATESQQISITTMIIMNIDHTKAFKECMDTYGILNGVPEFDIIALVITFYESTCNTWLVIMKSSASNYQQYSCKVHEGCNFHVSFG